MTWSETLAVLALVLAVAALSFALLAWFRPAGVPRKSSTRVRGHSSKHLAESDGGGPASGNEESGAEKLQLAVIVNSTKPGAAALRDQVLAYTAARYLPEPMWLSTNDEHRGHKQAQDAIAAGANIVLAAGGDGTVREVAGALAGTNAVLGIIPHGTGNLLARNLDIPVNNLEEALRICVEGKTSSIDIGWMQTYEERPLPPKSGTVLHNRSEGWTKNGEGAGTRARIQGGAAPTSQAQPFTVISGIGFDANMVADTDSQLKRRVGWLAYFWAGVKHMGGSRLRTTVQIDNRNPVKLRVRSLMVGNCGKLPGGIILMPDAVIDDGWLDIAALDTRAGIAGWADLFGKVVLQGMGVRSELPMATGRISHTRARRISISVPEHQMLQLDGDIVENAPFAEFWVEPGALQVRVAR